MGGDGEKSTGPFVTWHCSAASEHRSRLRSEGARETREIAWKRKTVHPPHAGPLSLVPSSGEGHGKGPRYRIPGHIIRVRETRWITRVKGHDDESRGRVFTDMFARSHEGRGGLTRREVLIMPMPTLLPRRRGTP